MVPRDFKDQLWDYPSEGFERKILSQSSENVFYRVHLHDSEDLQMIVTVGDFTALPAMPGAALRDRVRQYQWPLSPA